ncbi:MAG: matrixin family metalloprotease [Acidobacteria bacterium]|nr:matrixin family metalloprotease [Acidobacteriota bacterium]
MQALPRRLPVLAIALAVLAVSTPAIADLSILQPLDELTRVSPVIVRGDVYSVDAAWEDGTIYTYVTVDVSEVFRGGAPARITIKQLGGVVGEMGLAIAGQAAFVPGEEVMLFLGLRPRDNTLMTSVLWQGKWAVSRDAATGTTEAVRYAGDDDDGTPLLHDRLALADLERVTQTTMATVRDVTNSDIVFTPPEAPAPVNTVDNPVAHKIAFLGFSWHEVFAGTLIPTLFGKTKQPKVGTGAKQIKDTVKAQNAIKKTLPVFKKSNKYKGSIVGSDLRTSACAMDNVVFNRDPKGEIANDGTLAIGGAFFFTNILIRGFSKACNGFVVMNDGSTADGLMQNKTCYHNVLNHELLHAMGLGHSTKNVNLMFPSVSMAACQGGKITYGGDDKKGKKKLYNSNFAARVGH